MVYEGKVLRMYIYKYIYIRFQYIICLWYNENYSAYLRSYFLGLAAAFVFAYGQGRRDEVHPVRKLAGGGLFHDEFFCLPPPLGRGGAGSITWPPHQACRGGVTDYWMVFSTPANAFSLGSPLTSVSRDTRWKLIFLPGPSAWFNNYEIIIKWF